jgi:hypothetical protein
MRDGDRGGCNLVMNCHCDTVKQAGESVAYTSVGRAPTPSFQTQHTLLIFKKIHYVQCSEGDGKLQWGAHHKVQGVQKHLRDDVGDVGAHLRQCPETSHHLTLLGTSRCSRSLHGERCVRLSAKGPASAGA